MRKCSPQLFDQGVVASFDASQPADDSRVGYCRLFHGSSFEIIRVYLSLQSGLVVC